MCFDPWATDRVNVSPTPLKTKVHLLMLLTVALVGLYMPPNLVFSLSVGEQVAPIWLTCVVYLTSVCNASLLCGCIYTFPCLRFSYICKDIHRETNFHFGAVCCHTFPTLSNKFPSFFLSLSDELGRVRLRFGPKPGSDYINASFIDVRTTEHHSTLYTGSHE